MATSSRLLLDRARRGSREALGILLARCAPKLRALIAVRVVGSLRRELSARDLVQATFVKALRRFESFEGADGRSLMAWLARIAENEIRDQAAYHGRERRDAARRLSLEESPEAASLAARVRSQSSAVARDERIEALERALRRLPPDQREAIVLRALEERSFAELGARLGRSPDACRMLFARAMTALTLALGDRP